MAGRFFTSWATRETQLWLNRGSSWLRALTCVSCASYIGRWIIHQLWINRVHPWNSSQPPKLQCCHCKRAGVRWMLERCHRCYSAGASPSIQPTIRKCPLCARQHVGGPATLGQGLVLLRGINEPMCAKCLQQSSVPLLPAQYCLHYSESCMTAPFQPGDRLK